MTLDRLQVTYCFPHENQPPGERLIKARVFDGERTEVITFGRHTPFKTVQSQIPVIFGNRKKGKAV